MEFPWRTTVGIKPRYFILVIWTLLSLSGSFQEFRKGEPVEVTGVTYPASGKTQGAWSDRRNILKSGEYGTGPLGTERSLSSLDMQHGSDRPTALNRLHYLQEGGEINRGPDYSLLAGSSRSARFSDNEQYILYDQDRSGKLPQTEGIVKTSDLLRANLQPKAFLPATTMLESLPESTLMAKSYSNLLPRIPKQIIFPKHDDPAFQRNIKVSSGRNVMSGIHDPVSNEGRPASLKRFGSLGTSMEFEMSNPSGSISEALHNADSALMLAYTTDLDVQTATSNIDSKKHDSSNEKVKRTFINNKSENLVDKKSPADEMISSIRGNRKGVYSGIFVNATGEHDVPYVFYDLEMDRKVCRFELVGLCLNTVYLVSFKLAYSSDNISWGYVLGYNSKPKFFAASRELNETTSILLDDKVVGRFFKIMIYNPDSQDPCINATFFMKKFKEKNMFTGNRDDVPRSPDPNHHAPLVVLNFENTTNQAVLDDSPHHNNGFFEGDTKLMDVHGSCRRALLFREGGELELFGDKMVTKPTTSITIALWVDAYKTDGTSSLFSTIGSHSKHEEGQYHLEIIDGTIRWFHRNADKEQVFEVKTTSKVIRPHNWTHIAVTYDSGSGKGTIVVNAVKVAEAYGEGELSQDWSGHVGIGRHKAGRQFEGLLDELRIYDRVLTDAEIKELFQSCNFRKYYCGYTTDNDYGSLTTPSYPNKFRGPLDCTWDLDGGPDDRWFLRVQHFDIGDGGDCDLSNLEVRDGEDNSLIGSFCGAQKPRNIHSKSGKVVVRFISSGEPNGERFRIDIDKVGTHSKKTVVASDLQTCYASNIVDGMTFVHGISSGNFTQMAQTDDIGFCISKCCERVGCNTAFLVDDVCFGLRCTSKESCSLRPAKSNALRPVIAFIGRDGPQEHGVAEKFLDVSCDMGPELVGMVLLNGRRAGIFENHGNQLSLTDCKFICCVTPSRCDLVIHSGGRCYTVKCNSPESCAPKKSRNPQLQPEVLSFTAAMWSEVRAIKGERASDRNDQDLRSSQGEMVPNETVGVNETTSNVFQGYHKNVESNEVASRTNDSSDQGYKANGSGQQQFGQPTTLVANKIVQAPADASDDQPTTSMGAEVNKFCSPGFWKGEVLHNQVLVGGREAGQYTAKGPVSSIEQCMVFCCKEPETCDVAFMLENMCYVVHCTDTKSCRPRKMHNNAIRTKLAYTARIHKMISLIEKPQKDKEVFPVRAHGNDESVCSVHRLVNNSSLRMGLNSGVFTKLGHVKSMRECIQRSCDTQGSTVAFKMGSSCFAVNCYSEEVCQPQPMLSEPGNPLHIPTMIAYLSKTQDFDRSIIGRPVYSSKACQRSKVFSGVTLKGGDDAGEITDRGLVNSMFSCIEKCCEARCDVAFMRDRRCYSVICHDTDGCQTVAAVPGSSEIHLAYIKEGQTKEQDSTDLSVDEDSCATKTLKKSKVHQKQTLYGGLQAGNFTYLGETRDMSSCVVQCCTSKMCDIAYLISHSCYGVSCYTDDSCRIIDDSNNNGTVQISSMLKSESSGRDLNTITVYMVIGTVTAAVGVAGLAWAICMFIKRGSVTPRRQD